MKLFLAHLTGLLVVVVCVMLAGCEAEPADKAQITITPASATLAYGESVEFTATGWRDYTWSLQDASLGTLSRTKGDSTVFTSRSTTNHISYIYATAQVAVSGGGTNATATTTTEASGQAELVLGEGGTPSADTTTPLSVFVDGNKVSTYNVGKLGSLKLTATGGTSSYSWSVDSTNATISPSSGSLVTYTATTNAGVNHVTCESGGETASVAINTLP